MRRTRAALLLLLLPLAAACGDDGGAGGSGSSDASGTATKLPRGDQPVELDPADFTAGSDNRYFPLEPGTQWRFRETDTEGSVQDVVVTVTSETRTLANGIEARVVRDTVSEDGQLTEDTLDYYAQDADGTVWYLGEQTAEFEDGELATREGSFEAGVDGALPGVIMPADPQPGQEYRQEYYEGSAEDAGAVLATGQQVESPQGHYDDAVLTADTNPLEPDVLEYKLYAPGVGLVLTVDASGGSAREELLSTRTVDETTAHAAGTTPLGTPYE